MNKQEAIEKIKSVSYDTGVFLKVMEVSLDKVIEIVEQIDEPQLVVIAEVAKGKYKKHLINMTEWNMYVVEDVTEGTKVNKYRYEVEYMPESIIPVTITNKE